MAYCPLLTCLATLLEKLSMQAVPGAITASSVSTTQGGLSLPSSQRASWVTLCLKSGYVTLTYNQKKSQPDRHCAHPKLHILQASRTRNKGKMYWHGILLAMKSAGAQSCINNKLTVIARSMSLTFSGLLSIHCEGSEKKSRQRFSTATFWPAMKSRIWWMNPTRHGTTFFHIRGTMSVKAPTRNNPTLSLKPFP